MSFKEVALYVGLQIWRADAKENGAKEGPSTEILLQHRLGQDTEATGLELPCLPVSDIDTLTLVCFFLGINQVRADAVGLGHP